VGSLRDVLAVMNEANCPRGRILFVCRDATMLQDFSPGLHHYGYEVRTAGDWYAAVDLVHSWLPKVVLSDFSEDSAGVHTFYTRLRAASNPQILALLKDRPGPLRMAALAAGADDYIVAPFTMPELLARIKLAMARVRERGASAPPKICTADLYVNFEERRVIACGREQHLTPNEFELLRCLILEANRVVPHHRLLRAIEPDAQAAHPGKLRVYIRQLRKKLEPSPERPRYIRTEARIGYRFELSGGNLMFS
jgi:two-component system KDP operon response regulator KdpE